MLHQEQEEFQERYNGQGLINGWLSWPILDYRHSARVIRMVRRLSTHETFVGYLRCHSFFVLNVQQDHRDPSDHIIISHAIAKHLTLLSSDSKFSYYRNQGLDLIEYWTLFLSVFSILCELTPVRLSSSSSIICVLLLICLQSYEELLEKTITCGR